MGNKFLKNNKIRQRKAQLMLETVISFALIFFLVGGIVKIWLWANNQIVKREIQYNATRVAAGTGADAYRMIWPVYKPDSLREGEVLPSISREQD